MRRASIRAGAWDMSAGMFCASKASRNSRLLAFASIAWRVPSQKTALQKTSSPPKTTSRPKKPRKKQMDTSSLRVLQDLCAQKGLATTGEERFTDLMDMLCGSVATIKPKVASKAASKSTLPATSHEDNAAAVVSDKEEDDAGFDAFF
eukprot:4124389-Prymnesium_polylepis.1